VCELRRSLRVHTGAERVICPLELLAWGKVVAFGGNALEVVGVVLEAGRKV
jgi:hypothetical protein